MKVAFFVHRFPVISEAFVVNAAVGLIDAGHEVDIYALSGPGDGRHARHGLIGDYNLEARARAFGLRESPRRLAALAPVALAKLAVTNRLDLGSLAGGRETLVKLHEAALFRKGGRYDILHCHFGTLAETVLNHRRAGALSGRVVVHFRGFDISGHIRQHGEGAYDRVFKEADAFLTGCSFFMDRILSLGAPKERTALVRSGVAVERFRYRPRTWNAGEPLNLLAVGRLVEKKGFRFAIEAAARLVSRGIDVQLTIVGDGPLNDALLAQADALDVGERVHFFGPATHEQIAALLDKAHILVAPSTTASNGDQDASINTVKEAMAAGCPFVTTDHGGIPELVDGAEAGLVVNEADAEALADGIANLIARNAEWPDMGSRGRERITTEYSIEAVTATCLAAYSRALASPTNPASGASRR